MLNKAVFLDRDGTINIEKNYLYKIEDFEYLEGVKNGLKLLQEAGFLLIVITNQSGIARGYYTEEDYLNLNEWMISDLEKEGIHITASYYCPHHPNAKVITYRKLCQCRKPGKDLFYQAIKEHDIDVQRSYAIGDKMRDLTLCSDDEKGSLQGFLIYSKEKNEGRVHCIQGGILQAAQYIVNENNGKLD